MTIESGKSLSINVNACAEDPSSIPLNVSFVKTPVLFRKFIILPLRNDIDIRVVRKR